MAKSPVLSAISEIPGSASAKVRWTFANWQNSRGSIDESLIGKISVSLFFNGVNRKNSLESVTFLLSTFEIHL